MRTLKDVIKRMDTERIKKKPRIYFYKLFILLSYNLSKICAILQISQIMCCLSFKIKDEDSFSIENAFRKV